MKLANIIVDKMLSGDLFSKWLGIEILEISNGYCKLKMQVRKEMTNGFNIAHGGITYSLADSALAFAANSYGLQSLSIETSINHKKKVMNGDTLIAETKEVEKKEKSASYVINIVNQEGIEVAEFNGKVHITKNKWFKQ
tara:strand:- start:3320 stop:3736 length:417 start_codon:yes stop_codon:yes gene_type:complete